MPEDKTTEPTSSDPKPAPEAKPAAPAKDVTEVEVTSEDAVLPHQLSEVLVQLHEKAKEELGAAEVVLTRVRHEVGQRVTALFRKLS